MNHQWPKTPIPPGAFSVEVRCAHCNALSRKTVNGRYYPEGLRPCETPDELRVRIVQLAKVIDRMVEFLAVEKRVNTLENTKR